jgi:hypothetical protein
VGNPAEETYCYPNNLNLSQPRQICQLRILRRFSSSQFPLKTCYSGTRGDISSTRFRRSKFWRCKAAQPRLRLAVPAPGWDPLVKMAEYKVKFEVFEGPLDLLLYLIKKEEVDIYEVNLTRLATQFIEYIDTMRMLDLEIAGEFLVMAATLMYIKSRELLPVDQQAQVEGEDEGEDPRWELIRQLVEYKKFKDAAAQLQVLEARQEDVFPAHARQAGIRRRIRPRARKPPSSTWSTPLTSSSNASASPRTSGTSLKTNGRSARRSSS